MSHLLTTREVSREELHQLGKLIAERKSSYECGRGPGFWWPTFGLLALESALVIGWALADSCASAVWRRTIWQGCV